MAQQHVLDLAGQTFEPPVMIGSLRPRHPQVRHLARPGIGHVVIRGGGVSSQARRMLDCTVVGSVV